MTFYFEYHIEDFHSSVFVNADTLEQAHNVFDEHLYRACEDYAFEHKEQSVPGYYCDARVDSIFVRIK